MSTARRPFVCFALLMAFALVVAAPAAAAATFVDIIDVDTFSCTPGDFVWVILAWGTAPGDISDHYWTLGNQRTGAEESDLIADVTNGGVDYMGVPVPVGTQDGDVLVMEVRVTSMLGPDTFDSLAFYCDTGELYTAPQFAGVPVPEGFVQTSLTCSTAVFDRPGGEPVGANAVYAGQTWYLNPTPVEGPDGTRWTEIFVAGPHTVFIPTECVGAPTGF